MSKHYLANSMVSWGDEGEGDALLFNPDTCDSIIINETGTQIWNFIAMPHTTQEIVTQLSLRFRSIPVDQLIGDVEHFLDTLLPDFVQEMECDDE